MNADERAKVLAMSDDEAHRYAWQCDHAVKKPVVFYDALDRQHIRNQCQRCGNYGESIPKNGYDVERLPRVNEELAAAWRQREIEIRNLRDQLRKQQQDEQADAWWAAYDTYLKSPHWAALRRKVIARDGFECQLCFRRVTVETAHVHHTTKASYETFNLVGRSLPAECVTLCRDCHERIEAAKEK